MCVCAEGHLLRFLKCIRLGLLSFSACEKEMAVLLLAAHKPKPEFHYTHIMQKYTQLLFFSLFLMSQEADSNAVSYFPIVGWDEKLLRQVCTSC